MGSGCLQDPNDQSSASCHQCHSVQQMNNPKISRRDFLKLARTVLLTLSGLLGLAGLLRFLSYQSQPPAPTEFVPGAGSGLCGGFAHAAPGRAGAADAQR